MSEVDEVELVDFGFGPYMHLEPSTRFPVYTRGNAGEVWPDVAYPLSVSISEEVGAQAYRNASMAAGIMTENDLRDGAATFGGCFSGYMYLNLSFMRVAAIRTPGTTIEESDATFLGSEGVAPPHVPRSDDKNWRCSLRALRYGWRTLRTTSLPELDDDKAFVARTLESLTDPAHCTDEELAYRFDDMLEDFAALFEQHLVISGKAGGMVGLLGSICEKNMGDRSRALTLLGGLGGVESAEPSFDLWDLGRMVASDPWLNDQFDVGVRGLWDRLQDDPRAEDFAIAFRAFLSAHGSRGPNEWEAARHTWGTQPDMAMALVDRIRGADDRQSPSVRAAELAQLREAAVADARSELKGLNRWLFTKALAAATLFSQGRERSKTTVIRSIHAARLATQELGRRLAERSGGSPDDVYFVLRSELDAFVIDPAAFAEVIAQRRATRDALMARVPPFVFDGTMPRADTWPLRDELQAGASAEAAGPGEVFEGLGGCPGVSEGRARIVLDPSEPGDLGPGDVLVAPLTDPAWTPLFVPSEAVVVDVGGQMSHAVIVSRELGMPCVVAATDASRRIPDGARIRVDGSAGTVTVLEVP